MPQALDTSTAYALGGAEVRAGWTAERVRDALADLALPSVCDDGSLQSRLKDQWPLVDSMLGRDLLDPLSLHESDGRVEVGPAGDGFTHDGLPVLAGRDRPALPAAVHELLQVTGPVGLGELDETLTMIEAVRTRVNALEALEGALIERARRQALRADVLDEENLLVRAAGATRRRELAQRSVTSDIALAVHLGEGTVVARMSRAQALCVRAPRTFTAALEGKVGWGNAAQVADAVRDLRPETASALDAAVVGAAQRQNPRVFARTVRRASDRLHPTPVSVRHQEAACKRSVEIFPAADGMAHLNLYATAPMIHAIFARVTDTAKHARTTGDERTLGQLRADVTAALLLDDGALDHAWDQPALDTAGVTGPAGATDSGSGNGGGGIGKAGSIRREDRGGNQDVPSGSGGGGGSGSGTTHDQPSGGGPGSPGRTGAHQRTIPELAALARSIRPRVFVTIPVLTLLHRADAPAMLDGTVPIDPETAEALAGLAPSLTRILTHPLTGNVLAVDSHTYLPPAGLRHYVTARDAACRFPGCTRPAMAADGDHTQDFALGGRTAAANLAALCRGHHILKHQARYAVTQAADGSGTLTWTTPTGRTRTTVPHAPPATTHRTAPRPVEIPEQAAQDPGPDLGNLPEDPHSGICDPGVHGLDEPPF